MKIQRLLVLAALLFSTTGLLTAQTYQANAIVTAAPVLRQTPDARAAAMGECGVATEADAFCMYYNPAKYAFMQNRHTSFAIGFDLWTKNLGSHPTMSFFGTFAQKIGRSALAASLRYYRAGNVEIIDEYNQTIGSYNMGEFVADFAGSFRFGDYLSGGLATRFIYSNLSAGLNDYYRPGLAFAVDLGIYYNRPLGRTVNMSLGASVTNIGTKLSYSSYSDRKDFLPTTMRLGTGFRFAFHPKHSLAFNLQFSKLLVPTPPIRNYMTGEVVYGYEDDVNVFQGMFRSFYDAPGYAYNMETGQLEYIGTFYEELCEINTGIGLEYNLADHFFVRNGYCHRPAMKGGRDYFSTGLGVRFGIFGSDVSLNVPINSVVGSNPAKSVVRWNMYFAF